jgi:3-dehydroquinate synthetase
VALGTVAELRATARLGWTPPALADRAVALMAALGLPASPSQAELDAAWRFVGADKKRAGDSVRLPVVTGPGAGEVKRVTFDALRRAVLDGDAP